MTQTYSEQRQRALLKCSRELRAVACQILDDTQNVVELKGRNAPWALRLAVKTAKQAREFETLGYEQCLLAPGTVAATTRSQHAYHLALDAFHSRLSLALGLSATEAEKLTQSWLKSEGAIIDPIATADALKS